MNSDIEIIKGRLTLLFKRRPQTRYWLMLTNDTYDQTYNLFFNSQRANERLQSVPLERVWVLRTCLVSAESGRIVENRLRSLSCQIIQAIFLERNLR